MLHKSCLKLLSALLTQPIRFGSCSAVVPYLQKSEIKTNVKLIILEGSQLKKKSWYTLTWAAWVMWSMRVATGGKWKTMLRKGPNWKWTMENCANLLRKGSNLTWKMENYAEKEPNWKWKTMQTFWERAQAAKQRSQQVEIGRLPRNFVENFRTNPWKPIYERNWSKEYLVLT